MSDMEIKRLWPNNRPRLVTLDEMNKKGWALECVEPKRALRHRAAWFVNVFGQHIMHLIADSEAK